MAATGRLSRPGFDGDLEVRIASWQKGILSYGSTEEASAGVDRARHPACAKSGRPIAHIAHDLGIHPETLRQHEADSGKRPDLPTSQEREEIRRLRAENFELRRANEILKSASVFFAKERDPDRPK
jgi:transposase